MARGWKAQPAGHEAIFSLCPHHSLLFFFHLSFFPALFPLPFPSTYPLFLPIPHSRSSSSQSELAARQMKIYRSLCPVGGFNLICYSVVAETTKGRDSRWTLLLVKPTASKHFYIPSRRLCDTRLLRARRRAISCAEQ